MCFAQPDAQVTPTNPAPYSLDKSYGAVKSYTTGPDGKKKGGATIASQYQAELDSPNARDRIKKDPNYRGGTGSNLSM